MTTAATLYLAKVWQNRPTVADVRTGCASGPWLITAVWLSMGVLALLIPVVKWRASKNEYYDAYGYAVAYEQEQRAYEEAQRDNNNEGWYYPSCKWYDYSCRKAAYRYRQGSQNQDGNDERDTDSVPNWYLFLGGQTEEGRREMEEQGDMGNTASLNFVHAWTILMFITVLAYGTLVLWRSTTVAATGSLVVVLVVLFQFLLLNLLLLVQGVIQTDGRAMEDSVYGWYGQTSVLMVYTHFWLLLFCASFTILLLARMLWQWRDERRRNGSVGTNDDAAAAARFKSHDAGDDDDVNNSYVHIDAPPDLTHTEKARAQLI